MIVPSSPHPHQYLLFLVFFDHFDFFPFFKENYLTITLSRRVSMTKQRVSMGTVKCAQKSMVAIILNADSQALFPETLAQ